MAQGGSSVADLQKQLAELQAKQKEYQQNFSNVVGPRSQYDIQDYNYAVSQFRSKYGNNYQDQIRTAQQQLEAARKAATTPPPADNPPADNPPADKPPVGKFPPVSPLPNPEFDPISDFTSTDPNMTTQDTTLAGKTGEELEKALVQKQAERVDDASLPPEQTITPTKITEQPDEIISQETGKMGEVDETKSAEGLDVSEFQQKAPESFKSPTIESAQVGTVTPAEFATGVLSDKSTMKAQQGKLSPESLAVAATDELDPKATVRYQLAELFETLKEGQPLPAWAAPSVRQATAIMKQRGLGSSSMAAAATMQALMESGLQIAAADAEKYSRIQLQNLSNKQQAVLQNAAANAQMDTTNLNNRQVAAANNAKAFLSLDMQNLTNEQQSATISYQGQLQAMLTDQAQENAARQLNAKSQLEVDMFFADLGTQIETATLNRKAAIQQYNVSQENAMSQFNTQMMNAREQFNASMSAQIASSNAQWRRDINTANTAQQNAANQQNAMNLLSVSQQGLANLWQVYRDQAQWSMQISENNLARAHNAAMQAAAISANESVYDDKFEDFLIIRTIDNIFDSD